MAAATLAAVSATVTTSGVASAAVSATSSPFGPNVYVFDTSMTARSIQTQLDSLFTAQQSNQFGTARYAILFKPGSYRVNANLGYYEDVAGLALSPDGVTISGQVRVEGQKDATASSGDTALENFWRSVENLSITPPLGYDRWAVSQAAPMRRVHVRGNLQLHTANYGYASGGYIADTKIDSQVDSATQQQWYSRDSAYGSWASSVWNMVFSGVTGAPAQSFPNPPMTTLATTPVSREKPFLYVDSAGAYQVFVPALRTNASATTWAAGNAPGTSLPLSSFYIAKPSDTAATINSQLAAGKHLILTPGIYSLAESLTVTNPNTVVLGMGFPTLVPSAGNAAITVADVDGVRLAGMIVDAGPTNSAALVQLGASKTTISHAANPTSVQDVFFRVGGATAGKATTSLVVNNNDTLLDDVWAWRADHGTGIGWTSNTADTGLVVNGDNVTALGLFVEHYQKFQTVWNGQNGRTIFYQSELPYDVPSQAAWMSTATTNGYASYKVADTVTSHQAYGLGVYSFFNQGVAILDERAIEVPVTAGVAFHDMVTVFLNGSGGISHVINNVGAPVVGAFGTSYLVSYP